MSETELALRGLTLLSSSKMDPFRMVGMLADNPGEHLTKKDFAEELETSESRVSVCVRKLEHAGFISSKNVQGETRKVKGYYVSERQQKWYKDMCDLLTPPVEA